MIAITLELTQAAVAERLAGPRQQRLARQRSQGRLGLRASRRGWLRRVATSFRSWFMR